MSCKSGTGNTGVTACLPINEELSGLLFQPTYVGSARNSLLGANIGDADYLNDKINNSDEEIRLLPFQNLTEVTDLREDPVSYTDNTGVDHDPTEQPRKFYGEMIIGATPVLLGELQKLSCVQMSTFMLGAKGGLFGNRLNDDDMEGFEIVKDSLYFGWVKKVQGGKSAHIKCSFTIARKVQDKNIAKYEEEQITDSVLDLKGLVDVTLVDVTNVIATKIINFTAESFYGPLNDIITIEDLAATDMVMTLNGAPETIVNAPNTNGDYILTYTTAAVATDIVVLTIVKDGYDIAVLTYTLLP